MSLNNLATSNKAFSREKDNLHVHFQLINQRNKCALFIQITNNSSKAAYEEKMDNLYLKTSKQLAGIFGSVEQLYAQLLGQFDRLRITEKNHHAIITFEVKLGQFRNEVLRLEIKKKVVNNAISDNDLSDLPQPSKVVIDKIYVHDHHLFKQQLVKNCQSVTNKQRLTKLTMLDRNQKKLLKNIFIVMANSILRNYRNSIKVGVVQQKKINLISLPQNILLVQKNDLLCNILEKAVQRTQQTPVQQMDLCIQPQIPDKLIVVTQSGEQIPLQNYIKTLPEEQIQKKVQFYEYRQQKFIKCFNILQNQKQKECSFTDNMLKSKRKITKVLSSYRNHRKDNFQQQQF